MLFITHDMGVVAEIADRVAVMRQGRLVEVGALDNILRTPAMEYTRNLLSAVPSLVPRTARADFVEPIVLETSELGKIYRERSFFGGLREVAAAQDVTITLRKGRTLGIVGESGSGKSTVARCIVRLIDPTSGGVRLAGREISELPRRLLQPHRKRIQIIFQDPYRSLNPRITVGETIAEGPINFGIPRQAALAKARELLELVDLPPDAISRYPHQFSGGQRQRIAIARALALDPDVLVADEAVSALDVSVQAQVLELLDEIQTRLGIALLFITHDLRVAAQICDDVAVMQRGRIVEQGPAAQVLTNPQQAYTRQLLEAAPGRNGILRISGLSRGPAPRCNKPAGHSHHFRSKQHRCARHAKRYRFVACASRKDESNVRANSLTERIDGPYRRWRLPARDQHLCADKGDLRRLRAWRRLAVHVARRRRTPRHAQHQCRPRRFRGGGGSPGLGDGPDHRLRRKPLRACHPRRL